MEKTLASKRITLIERPDFILDLEFNETFAIIHIPLIKKLTKGVYLDMVVTTQEMWEFLSTAGYDALYGAIDPNDKTLARFVKKLGFIKLGSAQGMDVYQYEQYKEPN